MTSGPPISIVLPVLNAGARLAPFLEAWSGQRRWDEVHPVAVDSGSTDGTDRVLEEAGWTVVRILEDEFDHGTARNLGIGQTRSPIVVLTVDDAVPTHEGVLEELVEPFSDPGVIASYGSQVPRDGAGFAESVECSFHVGSARQEQSGSGYGKSNVLSGTPLFNNVISAVRRSAWEEVAFPRVLYGEDVIWAHAAIESLGGSIVYVPDATVRHSHNRGLRYEFFRAVMASRLLDETVGGLHLPPFHLLAFSMLPAPLIRRWLRRQRVVEPDDVTLGDRAELASLFAAKGAGRSVFMALRYLPLATRWRERGVSWIESRFLDRARKTGE